MTEIARHPPGRTPVFVAAGSNVQPEEKLAIARREILASWPDAHFSHAYRNWAVGFDGPDFINWVVGFSTDQSIEGVRQRLHEIEALCGRPRHAPKWQPRAMDLDILLFGDAVVSHSEYQLPRPDLVKRAYMLRPMAEIGPDVLHPTLHKTMAQLWGEFDVAAHPMVRVDR
jgi:2-amino-4-hydroxy-6-hydroxymethyldihydropteridine diphosphokinase